MFRKYLKAETTTASARVLVLAAGAGIAGLLLARELSGRLTGIVMPAMGPANLPYCMDFEPSDSR